MLRLPEGTHHPYSAWRNAYPEWKFILHNQMCTIEECFREPEKLLLKPSFDPERGNDPAEQRKEIWFDLVEMPVTNLTRKQLVAEVASLGADETELIEEDGQEWLSLWWD